MVKKLLRYEFKAVARIMIPVYLIVIGLSILTRGVLFFENDSVIYSVASTSSIIAFVISIIACLMVTVLMSIIRYYSSLYTREGYLSFTLPVTVGEHIRARLINSLIYDIISFFVCLASLCIISSGDLLHEIIKAIVYLIKHIPENVRVHTIFYAVELIIFMLVATAASHLLYYACIAIGQLFKKLKILAAVGVYFVYTLAVQFIATALSIVSVFFSDTIEKIIDAFYENIFVNIHYLSAGLIIFAVIGCAVTFTVSYLITKNKLNLE